MARGYTISLKRYGRRATLRIMGPIAAGAPAGRLLARVRRALIGGARSFIIDLSGVPFIDCSGIGMLVLCYEEVRRADGELRIARCRGPLRRMLSLSALLDPLEGRGTAPRLPALPGQDVPPLLWA